MGKLVDQVVKLVARNSVSRNFPVFDVFLGEVAAYGERQQAVYRFNANMPIPFDAERFELVIGCNPSGELITRLQEKQRVS